MYLSMLTWPVTAMGWVTSIIQRAAASQTRINEFLHIKPEIDDSQTQVVSISESIELRNVSFVYPDTGIKALHAVSFELKKGESLGIIGRTGSGKSTLANLLCRLYDPSEGSILIDKIDLTEINLNSYRQCIGYVPQEVFLFSDSIKNNIAFGLKEDLISEHKIHEAAKQAVVYDSIDAFPDKFEARLGERGITLSGGQKQRVSIARALIKSPALLIFDDCLSAVDTETEAAILYNLRQEMKNKFSVIISHRVSSVSAADKIIVLDEGKVCEQGSHTELLAAKGVYHDLYRKQLVHEN